jgi:prepilin-type N-terminal cleavage/methylation domain-containing protein
MPARRRGFTLLEVLAAAVLLGMLAAAAVPMTLRLGRGRQILDDRRVAAAFLDQLASSPGRTVAEGSAVAGHDDWRFQAHDLDGDPSPPPAVGVVPPVAQTHRWRWVAVRAGSTPGAAILAERMVLVLPEPAARPQP